MANPRTDLFLDLYRQLESAAEQVVGRDARGGTVFRLEQRPEFAPFRDELDCCREVRNLLSHEPKIDGEYAIHPGENLIVFLQTMLERVQNPPRVASRMTPVGKLVTAHRQTPLRELMGEMERRNISHVPLLNDGRVDGMFSVGTIFQAVLGGARTLSDETVLADVASYLPLERHMGQFFRFVSPELRLREARELFDRTYSRNSKLKLLLVTENGLPDRPLLGVLSPYDLLELE